MKVVTKNDKPGTVKLSTLKAGSCFKTEGLGNKDTSHRYLLGDYDGTFTRMHDGMVWSNQPNLDVIKVEMEARDI